MTADLHELRQRDRQARRLAQLEFRRPVVLEAGAGTGKTTTLVARVLAWCLGPGWQRATAADEGTHTSEAQAARVLSGVVAITFTEAAAAEMAARIAGALAEIAAGETPSWLLDDELPAAEERVRRARALAGTLDHLTVRTIHAFCLSLLTRHPLEARLHPNLTVDADGRLLEETVRETLEGQLRQLYGEPGNAHFLQLVIAGFGPEEVVETLIFLVGEGVAAVDLERDPLTPERVLALRDRLLADLGAFRPGSGPGGALASVGQRSKATLEALDALEDIHRRAEEIGEAALSRDPLAQLDTLCAAVRALPPKSLERLGAWSKNRFNKTEAAALDRLDSFDSVDVETICRQAGALRQLLRHLAGVEPRLLDHGRRALAPLLAEIEMWLRSRGIATFAALLAEAESLLADDAEVRRRVRRGIDQLLVDEFQDTDERQCRLLGWIALDGPEDERPGLFLVGDPKQSIYGWRSADLAAYEDFLGRVRAAGGRVEPLAENFRSVPAILDEVRRAVEPVMVEQPGLQPRFEPLLPSERLADDEGFRQGPWAPVEYWVSWTPETAGEGSATRSADATRLEAEALARDLHRLRQETGCRWDCVGLLLRSTSDLEVYLGALRDAGIPFAVGHDKQYYRRREILDAAALVRAILDPGDHLALLTLLRSPMVGVPDAALIPLWQRQLPRRLTELRQPDPRRLAQLRGIVEEAAAAMPRDVPGIERVRGWELALLAAVENLAVLRECFREAPADVFVERLRGLFLQEVLESARYLGVYRLANLERFLRRLLATLEDSRGDVTAVLRLLRISVNRGIEAQEGRPEDAGGDAVQVLTIHKAKGLDFEHVYLLQLHKESGAPTRPLAEIGRAAGAGPDELEYRLFGAATLGFDAAEARREAVEAAERVRLLYVAMTRAKRRLVLLGSWPRRDARSGAEPSPEEASSLLALLASRRPVEPALEDLPESLSPEAAGPAVDTAEARWVFPALAPAAAESAGDAAVPAGPDPAEVRRQWQRLADLRREARAHQQRPWSAAASDEAHRELQEQVAQREISQKDAATARQAHPSRQAPSAHQARSAATLEKAATARRVAQAAGSAVHKVLETLDLGAEPAAELARQQGLLPVYLAPVADARDLPAALAEGRRLLAQLGGGRLLARLRELAPHLLARELPVLLPPEEAALGPVAFVSGTIDLLYRDPETGEPVIADYKTDALEDADLEERAQAYAIQGRVYQRALSQALALPAPPRFELWFVQADRVVTVA